MRGPEHDLAEVIACMADKIGVLERRCQHLEAALASGERLVRELVRHLEAARDESARLRIAAAWDERTMLEMRPDAGSGS